MSHWVLVASIIGLLAGSLLEAHTLQAADTAVPGKPPAAAAAAPGAPATKITPEPRSGGEPSSNASVSARLDNLEKDLKAYQERALCCTPTRALETIQSRLDTIGETVKSILACLYVVVVVSIAAVVTLILVDRRQRRRWNEAVRKLTKVVQDLGDRRPVPAVFRVDPPTGPVKGGTPVKVRGRNFAQGATVRFGSAPAAASSLVVSSEVIETTTPAGMPAGPSAVTVQNPDGAAATNDLAFTYEPPPTIRQVNPQTGSAGTIIDIVGDGFRQGARAEVDGVAGVASFGSEHDLTYTMPPGTTGKLVKVAVINPDGQRADWGGQFTYR